MSGGRWYYMEHKLRDGEIPVAWIPPICTALGEIEHLVDWAVCSDTSKEDAMPQVWDRLVALFDELAPQ